MAGFRWLVLWLAMAPAMFVGAQSLPPMNPVQVSPSVWYVQGVSALGSAANQNFISNAGFVVTPAGVVVIDALGSPALATRLLGEIRKVTPKPVTHVIVTHYHADHIYGLQTLRQHGAKVIAHRSAGEYLSSDLARQRLENSRREMAPWVNAETVLVPPDQALDGDLNLDAGSTSFVIRHVGPAHTPEDLVVYLPSEKVLFAGDLVFRNRVPFVGQADSKRWIRSLETLLAFDASTIIPGHGPVSHKAREDMQLTRDYLVYLRETMGRAARDFVPFEEAYQATDWSRYEQMPLFHAANRMNAYNTYLLMEHEAP